MVNDGVDFDDEGCEGIIRWIATRASRASRILASAATGEVQDPDLEERIAWMGGEDCHWYWVTPAV